MRLVCPNCDAEYEVDAAVIPSAGRDVQCSNCGNSWFQPSPTAEADRADEADLFDAPPVRADTPPVRADTSPVRADAPAAAQDKPHPRGLDDTVVTVLREEAEREAAARRAEAGQPIETQTEMGLPPARAIPAATAAATAAAQRIARMKGVDPEPRPALRPQTRREMLPTIEEINSTLRATSERRTGEASAQTDSPPPARRGANSFRSGFVLVMLIAAAGVIAYVMAPRIAAQIPGLAPSLTGYVETVDAGRLWLDAVMQQAIAALRGMSGGQPA